MPLLLPFALAAALSLRIEPGAAIPIVRPQSNLFGLGGAGFVTGGLGVTRFLDLQLSLGLTLVPAGPTTASITGSSDPGTAFTLAAGLRLKLPHATAGFSPWLDAQAGYVRSGAVDRFGAIAGIGVSFPLDRARRVWFGPFARYLLIVAGSTPGRDSGHAHLIIAGLSVELASPPTRPAPPDRDHDGVPDARDLCIDEPEDRDGFQDDDGCPDLDNDGDGIPDAQDPEPNKGAK